MTRMEIKEFREREKRLQIINLLLIFIAIASITFGYVVNNENKKIKEMIENYNSDVKVYYLKQDIEGGNY